MAQVPIDVEYKGLCFEKGFRADLVINGIVIIELKSVEQLTASHRKQIQTYLRLTGGAHGVIQHCPAFVRLDAFGSFLLLSMP